MKSIIIKIIMPLLIGALISGVIVSALTGCKSFKPIKIESQPDECNDYYTLLNFYSLMCKKPVFGSAACNPDSAFLGVQYEKCVQARRENSRQKIKELCNELYSTDIKKYQECTK